MKDKLGTIKKPRCWICKDEGMVFYERVIGGIPYDFAYRCRCKAGQASSDRIRTVPEGYAEELALRNFRSMSS